MKTMAEEIAAHRIGPDFDCTCGVAFHFPERFESDYEAHLADALTAAGFGLVADAKREALVEAAGAIDLPGTDAAGYYSSGDAAGYAEAERHAEAWLRARAAAVRGER